MKRKRFSEEQIIEILRLHQAGSKPADLCRQHGISEATLYNWRSRYGGMEADMAGCRCRRPSVCGPWKKRTAS